MPLFDYKEAALNADEFAADCCMKFEAGDGFHA
jgi:hypothetical protein